MQYNFEYNLGQRFHRIAKERANAIALRFIDSTYYSYTELESLSNKIAHVLISKNISKHSVVAILNSKTADTYATMIACLKLGIIYVNLDFNSPIERLKKMLFVCKPSLVFVNDIHQSLINNCEYDTNKIICYQLLQYDNFSNEHPNETNVVTGNTPAYIMFTSGSTGFPKGVVISHANVLQFISWTLQTYNSTIDDVFTNVNPMHFDNSVFDFYASLFSGATMVPIPEDLTKQPRQLLNELNKLNPTIWFSVPSMLVYMLTLRAIKESDLPNLRIVTFGGEGFPKNQLRNLWKLWNNRILFINVYGPTECTCICSSYVVSGNDMISNELLPLGPIAPNFGFIIKKELGSKASDSEIGELYITGSNVGLGYYNNSEKTKEVFIQNPEITEYNEIVYKSGDLVRYSKTENLLYFCGRVDNQIKRMGYRIELEEIEQALGALSYIEENAVIFIKNNDNNGKIIACVKTNISDENTIFNDISKSIPSYMMPNEILFFDSLPKNQNGKIDRIELKQHYNA